MPDSWSAPTQASLSPEEFHGDRNLIGFRSIQAAAVRIARVRHAIINYAGEACRHHDCRQAADRAQIHREVAAAATKSVEIGFEAGLRRHEIGIGHLGSRLDARVVHRGNPTRIDERRWNGGVNVDEGIELVIRHHVVENTRQVGDAQRVRDRFRRAERFRIDAEGKAQPDRAA